PPESRQTGQAKQHPRRAKRNTGSHYATRSRCTDCSNAKSFFKSTLVRFFNNYSPLFRYSAGDGPSGPFFSLLFLNKDLSPSRYHAPARSPIDARNPSHSGI